MKSSFLAGREPIFFFFPSCPLKDLFLFSGGFVLQKPSCSPLEAINNTKGDMTG